LKDQVRILYPYKTDRMRNVEDFRLYVGSDDSITTLSDELGLEMTAITQRLAETNGNVTKLIGFEKTQTRLVRHRSVSTGEHYGIKYRLVAATEPEAEEEVKQDSDTSSASSFDNVQVISNALGYCHMAIRKNPSHGSSSAPIPSFPIDMNTMQAATQPICVSNSTPGVSTYATEMEIKAKAKQHGQSSHIVLELRQGDLVDAKMYAKAAKKSWHVLLLKYHPDKCRVESTAACQAINDAWVRAKVSNFDLSMCTDEAEEAEPTSAAASDEPNGVTLGKSLIVTPPNQAGRPHTNSDSVFVNNGKRRKGTPWTAGCVSGNKEENPVHWEAGLTSEQKSRRRCEQKDRNAHRVPVNSDVRETTWRQESIEEASILGVFMSHIRRRKEKQVPEASVIKGQEEKVIQDKRYTEHGALYLVLTFLHEGHPFVAKVGRDGELSHELTTTKHVMLVAPSVAIQIFGLYEHRGLDKILRTGWCIRKLTSVRRWCQHLCDKRIFSRKLQKVY
jgi:hypothetical protein